MKKYKKKILLSLIAIGCFVVLFAWTHLRSEKEKLHAFCNSINPSNSIAQTTKTAIDKGYRVSTGSNQGKDTLIYKYYAGVGLCKITGVKDEVREVKFLNHT